MVVEHRESDRAGIFCAVESTLSVKLYDPIASHRSRVLRSWLFYFTICNLPIHRYYYWPGDLCYRFIKKLHDKCDFVNIDVE